MEHIRFYDEDFIDIPQSKEQIRVGMIEDGYLEGFEWYFITKKINWGVLNEQLWVKAEVS